MRDGAGLEEHDRVSAPRELARARQAEEPTARDDDAQAGAPSR
jgi:hypothetical protein